MHLEIVIIFYIKANVNCIFTTTYIIIRHYTVDRSYNSQTVQSSLWPSFLLFSVTHTLAPAYQVPLSLTPYITKPNSSCEKSTINHIIMENRVAGSLKREMEKISLVTTNGSDYYYFLV